MIKRDFEAQVLADLAVVKAELRALTGNGQPGRIRLIEQRIERHEVMMQRGKTILLGLLPALGVLQLILHFAGKQ